jgi:hypothetical protein
MPTDIPHLEQVKRLSQELDKRIRRHELIEPYYEGACPLPPAITEARLTKVYRYLMPVAEAPWGSLVVDSKLDRLEVSGIRDQDKTAADKVWDAWQANSMDAESKLAHNAALLDGRAYATVWPKDGEPDIALDDCTQMVVEHAEGSRRIRTAALRRWQEDKRVFATLYRPDGIWKYQTPEQQPRDTSGALAEWEKREVPGEEWPLTNPLDVVNVVELRVNGRLKSGRFPHARGEFEHCTGLIDRINLLTFLGLVVAFTQGFPLRGLLGAKINRRVLKDDDGNPIIDEETGKEKTEVQAPFDNQPGSVFQNESPDAKIAEFSAADRDNLAPFAELDQLARISKTPAHYFPLRQGMSNLSAEAIMASEGSMHAAVTGHKASLGEGHEEILRLCGKIQDVKLSPRAELQWKDHESRSLAERADAAVKLSSIEGLPWQAIADITGLGTDDELSRWQAMGASDPLLKLVASMKDPVPGNGRPVPVPA